MVKFYAFRKKSTEFIFTIVSDLKKKLSRTKLGFIEKNTLYFKFRARYITVIYQEVLRQENYLLIVTYIRCCQDSKMSAGIVDISVGLMPQSNLTYVINLQSVCVAYRPGIHTLSMESVLVLLSEFFRLIFFMCK